MSYSPCVHNDCFAYLSKGRATVVGYHHNQRGKITEGILVAEVFSLVHHRGKEVGSNPAGTKDEQGIED